MRNKAMPGKRIARRCERGVALVLVVICLLLILTLSTLMILSAGVEGYLNANYRSSTKAFYAAVDGLEEGRGRLWGGNGDAAVSNAIKAGGTPVPVGQVVYIVNPAEGQTIDPTDLSAENPYADNEYQTEFDGTTPAGASGLQPFVQSAWLQPALNPSGLPGPSYQWVRINPVTEKTLNMRLNGDANPPNGTTPLYYDGTSLNLISKGQQVLEVTALSVLPGGARKMLQYVVQPPAMSLSFTAAVTMDGKAPLSPTKMFVPPNRYEFLVNGLDGCSAQQQYAVATTSPTDQAKVVDNIIEADSLHIANFTGNGGTTPNVGGDPETLLNPAFRNSEALDGLVQTITANEKALILSPQSPGQPVIDLPLENRGSETSRVITVVQGDLQLSGNISGYGLLLVTGKLEVMDGAHVVWKGIVLVIGKGILEVDGLTGEAEFDGAVLLAHTRNSSDGTGPLIPRDWVQLNWQGGGNGILYNSCWIDKAQPTESYRVLSFREIPQQ